MNDRAERYGTAEYRLKQANGHLDNFVGQVRLTPEDTDPEALGKIADRLENIRQEVLRAATYSRTCRARKVEAEARLDILFPDRRAA